MTKLEKVIKGLEYCTTHEDYDCENCPYHGENCGNLNRDALELLKEQEPRVLTLKEVRDEAEYMFLEKHSTTGSDLYGCAIRGDWNRYGVELLIGECDYYAVERWENYGKTWRCWNTRPTEGQREATPWDEPPKEEE